MVQIYRKRRAIRKRRYGLKTRRPGFRRIYKRKNIANKVYFYKQTINGLAMPAIASRTITQTALPQTYQFEWTLSQLANNASFAGLYDYYKIKKIVFKAIPMHNTSQVGAVDKYGTTIQNPGIIGTVIDLDGTGPTSLTTFEEYQNWKYQPVVSSRTHTRVLYPKQLLSLQNSGGSVSSSAMVKPQWLDVANASSVHYGINLYLDPYSSLGGAATYQIMATMYLMFKGVR